MSAPRDVARVITGRWSVALAVLALAATAGAVEPGTVQMWSFVAVNVLLAQSINVLTGITGQISLGHAGFFAIGSYATSVALTRWGVPFPVAWTAATLVAAAVGFLLAIPAGRVREFYLAMMTLAFGVIVYEAAREWRAVTGGVIGMRGVPSPSLGTLRLGPWRLDAVGYFRLLLACLVVVLVMLRNFVKSHFGRAMYAVHVSPIAAGSLAISEADTKRFAYALSAAMAGLAGGMYACLMGYVGPEAFGLLRSVEILVMSILGGLGSLTGQVLGALVFTYLPQKLQAFADYQFIVYGVVLIFSFTLLPKGLAGLLSTHTRYSKLDALRGRVGAPRVEPASARGSVEAPRADAAPALVRVEDIVMRFAGLRALDRVTLELHPGRVTALVGPNGSGKSTLVNVIGGIYAPTSGRVLFRGREISGWPAHRVARLGITRTFQDPRNVPNFTVRENVLMGAHRLYRHGRLAAALNTGTACDEEARFLGRVEELMARTELSRHADEVVGALPYGLQRMVEVARALASDPELLLLDEPAAGLSERELGHLRAVVRAAAGAGISVLLIDHDMEFLAELASEVVVLDAGAEIYRGDMTGMRTHPAVIEAYLGARRERHAGGS
jgi:branched-chain amino acid transport system permease protein